MSSVWIFFIDDDSGYFFDLQPSREIAMTLFEKAKSIKPQHTYIVMEINFTEKKLIPLIYHPQTRP